MLNRHIYSKANKNFRGEEIKITMVSRSPLYSVDVKDTEQTPVEDELGIATEASAFTAERHAEHVKKFF